MGTPSHSRQCTGTGGSLETNVLPEGGVERREGEKREVGDREGERGEEGDGSTG